MNPLSEQLRALPAHEPPVAGWSALQRRMRVQRRRTQARYAGFAVAASLLLTLGLLLWQPRPALESHDSPQLAQLIERSSELEHALVQLRPQARRWDAGLVRSASAIQDQLALVDLQLNYAEDAGAERLWQNRVSLMSQLVQTHELATQPASLHDSETNNEEFAI